MWECTGGVAYSTTASPVLSLPLLCRAVRGKLGIAELDLVGGVSGFRSAGIDWWRPFDRGDGSTGEQELADEFGQPERKHLDAVGAGGDAQQQVGNHCSKDLQADCIIVVAKEVADIEVLLDPAKQQFNLPTALVESGDLDCGAGKIVGEESNDAAGIPPELDAPQRYRQSRVALASELDLVVGDDLEAVAIAVAVGAMLECTKADVRLHPGDEESLAVIDLLPPVETAIRLVEHVSRARLDRNLAADLGALSRVVG